MEQGVPAEDSKETTLSELVPHRGRVRVCCLSGQYQRIGKRPPSRLNRPKMCGQHKKEGLCKKE